MSERKKEPDKGSKSEEIALAKMDLSLRKLMKTSDSQIRKDVQQYQKEVAKKMKEPPPEPGERPAEKDRVVRPIDKGWERYRLELLPPRHLTAIIPGKLAPLLIRAIVNFTGNRSDLEAIGIQVRSQAQDIFTITATKKQLLLLGAQAACHRLRTPRLVFHNVEQASAQAEIADVHVPRPVNPTGFQGNGTLVGVIDSCLDVTHHGFRDPIAAAHGTRALYYWVQQPYTRNAQGGYITQSPPGQTPEQFHVANPGSTPDFTGLNYGRIYTSANINTALTQPSAYGTGNNQICCQPFYNPSSTNFYTEHGTHCMGIAAGSGHVSNWATAPTHIGSAPQSTLIFVALQLLPTMFDAGGSFEDALIDGIDFCVRAATYHNMPVVMSISQGSNWGPHNGNTDFDLARDNFINSFDLRSLVTSSGNDNSTAGFRKGSVAAGNSLETFTMTFQAYNGWPVWLDVWYTGPQLDYRISYGGNNTGWLTAGQPYSGNVSGRYIEAEREVESGGGLRSIRIYSQNVNWHDVYTIELRNPDPSNAVDYWAWTGAQGWWASLSGFTIDELTLGDTSCGRAPLTVGACSKVTPPNPAAGENITAYSGAGPTQDGRIKPEIAAIGGDGNINTPTCVWSTASDQNSGYAGMCGTSMSTPLVAGAVALLFEEYRNLGYTLNQDTIKAILTQGANRLNLHIDPAQPGYVASERNRYGYGRLRMIGPIDEVLPPLDVDVWIRTADDDYGQEPYPGGCCCGAPDIKVCQMGTNTEITSINWDTIYDVKVTVRNLGDTNAVGTAVRLKYALPNTAPNTWFWAEDASDIQLEQTVTVPAMDQTEITFHWRPQASELPAPSGQTHFCLLAEADHVLDPLVYLTPGTPGGDAFGLNVRGINNIALQNLNIY